MRKFAVITVALLALFVLSSAASGHETLRFAADLVGVHEVPPVKTETTGEVTVRFNQELTAAQFRLTVEDGTAVTMAHFHCAFIERTFENSTSNP